MAASKPPCPELSLSPADRRRRYRLMARIQAHVLPKSQKARREVQPGNRNAMGKVRHERVRYTRWSKYMPHQGARECARRRKQMGLE